MLTVCKAKPHSQFFVACSTASDEKLGGAWEWGSIEPAFKGSEQQPKQKSQLGVFIVPESFNQYTQHALN